MQQLPTRQGNAAAGSINHHAQAAGRCRHKQQLSPLQCNGVAGSIHQPAQVAVQGLWHIRRSVQVKAVQEVHNLCLQQCNLQLKGSWLSWLLMLGLHPWHRGRFAAGWGRHQHGGACDRVPGVRNRGDLEMMVLCPLTSVQMRCAVLQARHAGFQI